MHSLAITLLASSLMLSTPTLAHPAHSEWCTFYNENLCEVRSGKVNYDISNLGVFQNDGPYLRCGASSVFSLISYPAKDSWGSNPDHCHVFSSLSKEDCVHLDDLGFSAGDGGYYRLSYDQTCPPIWNYTESKPEVEQQESEVSNRLRQTRKLKDGWLIFYDDPYCELQSGGVHYSIDDTGCFENGGQYAYYGGKDVSWHLEQWTGVGNKGCSGTLENCSTEGDLNFFGQNSGCIDLAAAGFQPGTGSYRIEYAGCA